MNKEDIQYSIGRNLSTGVFDLMLNPKIIDSEKIPEEKPIIFCSNHLHVWDQFPIMCATKDVIHWMAKKEYFEGKLAFAFKYMGCIPVDRVNNPNASKEIALDYLNKGHCVGLFPEGTRNGLKQEKIDSLYSSLDNMPVSKEEFTTIIKEDKVRTSQIDFLEQLYKNKRISKVEYYSFLLNSKNALENMRNLDFITEEEYDNSLLLPFKYGAVSMAKKSNATIVPVGVTGDYTVGNDNLTVKFGEPFKVEDDLTEANTELRKRIIKLIK